MNANAGGTRAESLTFAPSLQITYGNQRLVIPQNVLEALPLEWLKRFERLVREAREFVEVDE